MNKINYSNIKRAWLISDIHFGVRSSSLEWLDIHDSYFYNFFIPLLKKNYKEGDALFVLGDVFESRQSINILVLNKALEIFRDLSRIMPIVMIVGNHDIYRKQSNDVNSAIIFNTIDNIEVHTSPIIKNVRNASIFLMPWVEDKENEINVIKDHPADYMFCHTDFLTMKYNRKVDIELGLDSEHVSKYNKVYSGHIHFSQHLKNIRMIGCPFQLTRGDISNQKYVYNINFETGEETRFANNYSPIFLKFKIDDILNITIEDMKRHVKNNYVDFIIEGHWVTKFPFALFADSLEGHRKVNYVLSSLQKDDDTLDDEEYDGEEIDLEKLIALYCNELPYADKTKEKLLEVSLRLYKKAINLSTEKEI
jgi:DNA repair exonuclease SbcCD nuclease subunit